MKTDIMLDEFKIEASEMFQNAEDAFLNIENGMDFSSNYNSIFRSFHSLKGAAGMFGLDDLQSHMHNLESLFEGLKINGTLQKHQVDYFLLGIDAAKSIINGESTSFCHIGLEEFNQVSTSPVSITPKVVAEGKRREDRKKGVVFIVDDEPEIVEILSIIIESDDYVIHKFFDGREALNAFTTFKPDVILSDIIMPHLNGIELLKEIYKINSNIPIVFISGNVSKERMQEALSYGAYAFIDKPFDNLTILNTCRNALKKSQAMRLLDKSINFILYQFSDIDQFLKSQGRENVRLTLKNELQVILELRKILKKNS